MPDLQVPPTDDFEDEAPPPAYHDVYGTSGNETRDEKAGSGTSARVNEDGRVDIRINHINRRLSQLFNPAIRQQVESNEEVQAPPLPYIPPSLGGAEGIPPPPPLNVVIQVVGSRGDVQPFVALGKVLKQTYGHRVRLATHPTFKDFVEENGLEFFSIGGDPSLLMAFMVKNPGLMPGFRSIISGDVSQRKQDVSDYIQGCWRSCYMAGNGLNDDESDSNKSAPPPFVADCIIANPPSFAHIHCAEKLGVPLHIMFTMPYSPTQAFSHPLANIQSSNADPHLTNYLSYAMIERLTWQGLGEIINRFRSKCLGLDPVSMIWGPGMLERLKVPHTYCWSPALIPKPKDWGPQISLAGFYQLDLASNYTPPPELQAFLENGPPPVYIGFGSIVLEDPDAMTELIFQAVKKTGQRVLLSKGWGGMGEGELQVPDGVFMLGNVPHDWLFKRVSCVVHHGGAGTTSAGITAGRPTLVVPFFGDQPFWGAMVARAGAGPPPIPHRQLTADKLADAIEFCLRPESLERAKDLARKISAERGTDVGAQSFHQFLQVDRLRCDFIPSRAAAWRIRRTKIRLSAFAACTLANAGLLDFKGLKLFRSQEYETDEGPWDPISGGFVAACGAFGDMGLGLVEIPTETFKAMQMPFKSNRQGSQSSTPKAVSKSESSITLETTAKESQTSFGPVQTTDGVFSRSTLGDLSRPTSKSGSSSRPDSMQSQLGSTQSSSERSKASDPSKDRDMLRHSGAHSSKGLGRTTRALVESPMELAMGLTKGLHNMPKLWNDETARPQPQVTDFKSGARVAGKEFGLGFYDGITGLVTQPWKGAQKEGAIGFFKGLGKGLGGMGTKPMAGAVGILGYTMKGTQKEVMKLFGGNVQSYIIASRTAQGYEEWLASSEADKEDVIARWKLIQKYLKKRNADEIIRAVLSTDQKQGGGSVSSGDARLTTSTRSVDGDRSIPRRPVGVARSTTNQKSDIHALDEPQSSQESLGAAEMEDTYRYSLQGSNSGVAVELSRNASQGQQAEATEHDMDEEMLRQALAASEADIPRHELDAQEHQITLQQPVAQSPASSGSSGWESNMGLDEEDSDNSDLVNGEPERGTDEKTQIEIAELPGSELPPVYDPGHLAGTTRGKFETQRQTQHGEKTMQERTEEDIVLEYVKKQSLLEEQLRGKGKSRAAPAEDEEDEDLTRALKMSLQEHERGEQYQSGEASRR